ncbi:MAG TPA: CCA tRNA nucleotidyltransferase [Candidatus Altiarchaeales archaeon]|nr:CCA tRNA nucleotidyltransferase [Candidatus Altiarchaeales archaeon]
MKKLLKEILKEVTPTEKEHKKEKEIADNIVKRLKKFEVKPILVGSLAKGTDVRDDKDIDIFIMFPKDLSREDLEKKGLDIGKKIFKEMNIRYEIDYAEHPYIRGVYDGYRIEIVPCYETKEPRSSVDRTPYHTQYVRRKLMRNPRLKDEIRLLKQFMKGINVYGAEAKVQGFSGYLAELLCINYGSFMNVLKAVSEWNFGECIDPEDLWRDKSTLKYFFTNANLIIVDPVDRNRNAAAAVSRQKLAEFIVASAEFLKSPQREFFFPQEEKLPDKKELLNRMKARGTKLIAVKFEHERINPNILYSQLRKTKKAIKKSIEEFGFQILKSDLWTDEISNSLILFDFEVFSLPRVKHHLGPPIDKAVKEQENFLEKYKKYKPYIKEGRWVVDTKREFTLVEELIPRILEERRGFGKNLRKVGVEVLKGEELLKIEDDNFLKFMNRFLTPL